MLTSAFIFSLVILFLHASTWEGHIFHKIRKVIPPTSKWHKPIYGCPICMGPWYGTILYLLTHPAPALLEWILTVFTTAGFGVIHVILISVRDAAVDYHNVLGLGEVAEPEVK